MRREVIRLMMAEMKKIRPGVAIEEAGLLFISILSLVLALIAMYLLFVKS
ncbi:hypothetical protein IPA_04635 [Ignicoccus pacificus DSM 13166]|uniref:Uncharacterized protein n=1 Tax=Ignicoccus pacificus DSM 13166 TaxID=940294 RepID=A0A977KC58_9CREN|nr:hypothetical protein IPA_04635 [Ignicoccus pacificus DSM 13166]